MATEVKRASKFGDISLSSAGSGKARWIRGSTSPLDQKGSTGWLAELYGGVQSGDDWARVNIPVNEMYLVHLKQALWTYYMTNTETMGVGTVIWVHDPKDNDKRAEITQQGGHADLEKASGWDAHELSLTTDYLFYYGENVTSAAGAATALTAGTLYGLDDFQADSVFREWTIYRITFEYGWEASGTFESAYVADIKINGEALELRPVNAAHRKTVLTTKTVVGGANSADDIVSENITTGTDWDFDFGGTGAIVEGTIVSATNAITPRSTLFLYTTPPTCTLNDNVASDGPVAADVPYLAGWIDFPGMTDSGSGHSYSIGAVTNASNLPVWFDAPILYGVLVSKDAATWGNALVSIKLTAAMDA